MSETKIFELVEPALFSAENMVAKMEEMARAGWCMELGCGPSYDWYCEINKAISVTGGGKPCRGRSFGTTPLAAFRGAVKSFRAAQKKVEAL